MSVADMQQVVRRIVTGQVRGYLQDNPHMVATIHQRKLIDHLAHRIAADIGSEHHVTAIRKALES